MFTPVTRFEREMEKAHFRTSQQDIPGHLQPYADVIVVASSGSECFVISTNGFKC
jgi:hypothetical protein